MTNPSDLSEAHNLMGIYNLLVFFLPIFSGVGCSVILESYQHGLDQVIRTPNRAGACGIHVLKYNSNSLFIGASNYISPTTQIKNKVRYAYYLLQNAMEQIDQRLHDAEILKWSVGCRPVSLDTFPLIGETSISGLWLLSGTYRDGVHLSPVLAEAVAKKILSQPESIIGDIFAPERAPIQTMTKVESINQFVNQAIASAYEHSMRLPRNGWDEQLPIMLRHHVEKLYQELDCNVALPVEILLMLERNPQLIPNIRKYLHSRDNHLNQPLSPSIPISLDLNI